MGNKAKNKVHAVKRVDVIRVMAEGLADTKEGMTNYLEVGIRDGLVFNHIAPMVKRAYAVDIDSEAYATIRRHKNLHWYHGKSEDFFKQHSSSVRFDLVFIDADHSHEASLRDFEMAAPLVRDNGLILMHDTYPPEAKYLSARKCHDSYKTAWHIRQKYSDDFEIVTLPFYFGLSVIRKANRQLLWKESV